MGNVKVEHRDGDRGVKIHEDQYGIEVLTMRNGFQWSGFRADRKLLEMLRDAMREFMSNDEKQS